MAGANQGSLGRGKTVKEGTMVNHSKSSLNDTKFRNQLEGQHIHKAVLYQAVKDDVPFFITMYEWCKMVTEEEISKREK